MAGEAGTEADHASAEFPRGIPAFLRSRMRRGPVERQNEPPAYCVQAIREGLESRLALRPALRHRAAHRLAAPLNGRPYSADWRPSVRILLIKI